MPDTPKNQGYALFDLDQTLIPWDTQLLFCDFILKRMPLRRLYLLGLIPLLPFYKILGAEGMKRVFLNYLWGLDQPTLDELASEFVEQHFPDTFYPEIIELLEQQKQSGKITILTSASPEIWVKPIAEKLGFDHYFGTSVEITPRIRLFPDLPGGNNKGANKLRKMRHLLPFGFDSTKDKIPNSHGFSDSHADLPMLSICDQVTMIHPTTQLREIGKQQQWELQTPTRPTKNKRQFAWACLRQSLGINPNFSSNK